MTATTKTMNVQVATEDAPARVVSRARVERAARAMLSALELDDAELSVLLCDDAVIHRLNRDYRKKDKPTDVLAFAMREGEGSEHAGGVLGDVVISLETAKRQAREAGHAAEREVLLLLAHGILHLLGWDHRDDAEDARMRREVDRLVGKAGAESTRGMAARANRGKKATGAARR